MTFNVDFTFGPWNEAEPFHSHPQEQTSYVAEGEIIFYCESEPDSYHKTGDLFAAISGQLHTIRLLNPNARLIDSFYPIRERNLLNKSPCTRVFLRRITLCNSLRKFFLFLISCLQL